MNTPGDEPQDEVTSAYRRASDPEAGRPAAPTRAAILAEARAAALRRTPAANDSRYVWRAAAGIAVLGIAVVLWRQVDRQVSPDLTVAVTDSAEQQASADTAKVSREPVVSAERSEARATASVPRERESQLEDKAAGIAVPESAAPAAPAAESLEIARADAAPRLAASAVRQEAIDYQGLLQREFPGIWSGDASAHTAWLVMDASGQITRKGTLSGAETLTAIADQRSGSWTVVDVKTASGSSLRLAVRNLN